MERERKRRAGAGKDFNGVEFTNICCGVGGCVCVGVSFYASYAAYAVYLTLGSSPHQFCLMVVSCDGEFWSFWRK
jgi:hypothetical protein